MVSRVRIVGESGLEAKASRFRPILPRKDSSGVGSRGVEFSVSAMALEHHGAGRPDRVKRFSGRAGQVEVLCPEVVLLELVPEVLGRDPEELGGLGLTAVRLFEGLDDESLLHFAQGLF